MGEPAADATPQDSAPHVIGRYALFSPIAAGGMATVHLGRLLGPVGFARTVAIKRLHAEYARDPEFVSMFLDEARLAARIRHPNVVPTLDVVATKGELFLVMEYVQGESLSRLVKSANEAGKRIPVRMVVSILSGALQGLHAAHEATDERGASLGIVHRDVSPQNILVGADGMTRVLDFGVAKASGRMQTTREGQIKGKLSYMPPEQLHSETLSRRADIYAASVVMWEALTGQRLFRGDTESIVLARILNGEVSPPSKVAPELPPELDALVMRGLSRDPNARFATAREMALALDKCVAPASLAEMSEWLETAAGSMLTERAAKVKAIENDSGISSVEAMKAAVAREITGDSSATRATEKQLGGHDPNANVYGGQTATEPWQPKTPASSTRAISSQVSSLSVSASSIPEVSSKSRGRRALLGAVFVVTILAIGGIGFTHFSSAPQPAATAQAITTPTSTPDPTTPAVVPDSTIAAKPIPTTPEPLASASSSAAPEASAAKPATKPARPHVTKGNAKNPFDLGGRE